MNPNKKQNRSVCRDVIVCLGVSLFIAAAFSGWVLTLYFFRGNRLFERLDTSLGNVILLYFAAAILVGPFVGLLLPLARAGRAGAALTGTVAAAPFYAMVRVTVEGLTSWTIGEAVVVLVLAAFVGAPVGLAFRRMFGG